MNELGPIVAGFLLTTVPGGLLATNLKNRSWSHQYAAQSAAKEAEKAVEIFGEVSRLLDRRLYRMRRLYWALGEDVQRPPTRQTQKRMDDYVAVLYEWNDSINRNLALIHRYFGSHSREVFDFQIGAQMRELGVLRRDVVDTQGLKTRRTSGLSGAV
jgi:hypothetical protein